MKIIISPAKKMRDDVDSLARHGIPELIKETALLLNRLSEMTYDELKKLWKCSDQIVDLNIERLKKMDLYQNLTPAVLAYDGIQFQYMAPSVFTDMEFDYIQEHLRILSGFYGVLRPFDGVTPYRLEMQAKLDIGSSKNLYEFWGDRIADCVLNKTDCVINLASKEYSQCVSKYLPKNVRFITCVFGELQNGKILEKGTMCKMARGEMVRYMAERKVKDPESIKDFQGLGHRYSDEHSNFDTFVFIK